MVVRSSTSASFQVRSTWPVFGQPCVSRASSVGSCLGQRDCAVTDRDTTSTTPPPAFSAWPENPRPPVFHEITPTHLRRWWLTHRAAFLHPQVYTCRFKRKTWDQVKFPKTQSPNYIWRFLQLSVRQNTISWSGLKFAAHSPVNMLQPNSCFGQGSTFRRRQYNRCCS